mgnify:CR=1 FL=1
METPPSDHAKPGPAAVVSSKSEAIRIFAFVQSEFNRLHPRIACSPSVELRQRRKGLRCQRILKTHSMPPKQLIAISLAGIFAVCFASNSDEYVNFAHGKEVLSFVSTNDMHDTTERGLKAFVEYLDATNQTDGIDKWDQIKRFPHIAVFMDGKMKELLRDYASTVAAERLVERDQDDYVEEVQTILPRLTADEIALLPAPGTDDAEAQIELKPGSAFSTSLTASEKSHAIQAFTKSLEVVEKVTDGAVSRSGALPPAMDVTDWVKTAKRHREKKRSHTYRTLFIGISEGLDVEYMVATDQREKEVELRNTSSLHYNPSDHEDLEKWFVDGGGKLTFVEPVHADPANESTRLTHLEVTETLPSADDDNIDAQDAVIDVPVRLTMSQDTLRLEKHNHRPLTDKFKPAFQRNQVWGLAAFLLFESGKREGSRWWPLIKSLRMNMLRKNVLRELKGTSVESINHAWDQEAEQFKSFLDKHDGMGCGHDFDDLCGNMKSRAQLRWGLQVVRQYAVRVTKASNSKFGYLALVPYAHLLRHTPGAKSSVMLHFDNHVRVHAREHGEGDTLGFDFGPMSNAECLLRYQHVPENNPNDGVRLFLPGVPIDNNDLYLFLDTLIEWRRLLRYPPKSGDLWDASRKLQLYGNEFDKEEEEVMNSVNKLMSGQATKVDSYEKLLLLHGGADSFEEAKAVVLSETNPAAAKYSPSGASLYTAIPIENDDDDADLARLQLSNAVLELQDAVAAGHDEVSVLKTINKTRAFFEHGVRPRPGMDPVDKMMKRKRDLLGDCGDGNKQLLRMNNVTAELLCSVRIHLIHETEADYLCPPGEAPFHDHQCDCAEFSPDDKCEGPKKSFNQTQAISKNNEAKALGALLNVMSDIRSRAVSTLEADETALAAVTRAGNSPLIRDAIRIRIAEKRILDSTIDIVREMLANLDGRTYQVDAIHERQEADKAVRKAQIEYLNQLAAETSRDHIAVALNVTLEDPSTGEVRDVECSVKKGRMIDDVVRTFAMKHNLPEESAQALRSALMQRAPVEPPFLISRVFTLPDGRKRTLLVQDGGNITDAVYRFAAKYNLTEGEPLQGHFVTKQLNDTIFAAAEARKERALLLAVPVDGPDGRKLTFEIREGEQHDIYQTAVQFAAAYKIHNSFAENLANQAHQRLQPQVAEVPVNMGQATVPFRVRQRDDLDVTIPGFMKMYGLQDNARIIIKEQVMDAIPPGAFIMGMDDEDD